MSNEFDTAGEQKLRHEINFGHKVGDKVGWYEIGFDKESGVAIDCCFGTIIELCGCFIALVQDKDGKVHAVNRGILNDES